jgi:hypothetical protein
MDKKLKHHRRKTATRDELEEAVPRGASFDTEQGRAAQGMRDDIARGGGETVSRDPTAALLPGALEGDPGVSDSDEAKQRLDSPVPDEPQARR